MNLNEAILYNIKQDTIALRKLNQEMRKEMAAFDKMTRELEKKYKGTK
jgi:hypothetical protein